MASDLRTRKAEKLFENFDHNGNGILTAADITSMAEAFCQAFDKGPGSAEWNTMQERAGAWWQGLTTALGKTELPELSKAEWIEFSSSPAFEGFVDDAAVPYSMAAFALGDTDGDGQISLEEMLAAQSKAPMSGAETRALFTRLDVDGDGYVSKDEFQQATRAFYLSDDPEDPGNIMAGRL